MRRSNSNSGDFQFFEINFADLGVIHSNTIENAPAFSISIGFI